ncbi:MAG: AAA family ATPase [Dermatophilaceae bacterium]
MILIWEADTALAERYRFALGADARTADTPAAVGRIITEDTALAQIVVGPHVDLDTVWDLAEALRVERPEVGCIVLRDRVDVAVLTQALQLGVREVVSADDTSALLEALRRSQKLTSRMVSYRSGGGAESTHGKVVTVFSAKGGVGKTAVSTNLAVTLASSGARTLLVDLDLSFGDDAISLQLLPTRTMTEAVAMTGSIDGPGLASLVTRHEASGLDVLCAPSNPADADRIPVQTVAEILRVGRQHYDWVVVDTPPSFTEHVLAACDISDRLVLIATLDIPAVKNLKLSLDTLDLLGVLKDSRFVVINRADTKQGLRVEDVMSAIDQPIAATIPHSPSLPNSVNRGVALVLDEPRHPVSLAIRELADAHVVGTMTDDPEARTSRRQRLTRSRR